jgi:Tripartite tricarboxylate transporter TctB family
MRKVDITTAVLILGFAALMVFIIIPREHSGGIWHGLSPYFYPMVMLAGVTLGGVGLLVQALTRPGLYDEQPKHPITREEFGFFLLISAVIFVAVLVIHKFGIWIGGPFLIAAVMIFMGELRPHRIALVAFPTVVVAWALVTFVLKIPLP